MIIKRMVSILILPVLLVAVSTSASWAWRGGPRIGVYLGPGPGWGYDPYYDYPYDPYYYNYYAPPPYPYYPGPAYIPDTEAANPPASESAPSNSHADIRSIRRQVKRARAQVDYEYDDGDISKEQYNDQVEHLAQIERRADAAAQANGGNLTPEEAHDFLQELRGGAPPRSSVSQNEPTESQAATEAGRSPDKVEKEISSLSQLLDEKLSSGDITKGQHDGLKQYLERISQQVHSDASANGGALTPDQESTVLKQLARARQAISKNLVGY